MRKIWLIATLLPLLSASQEVKPILSNDYLSLIRKDTAAASNWVDSTNNLRKAPLHFMGSLPNGIFNIKGSNQNIKIRTAFNRYIIISGTISLTSELQKANRQASLQKEFIQGRNTNGTLSWQGPETNELFSYGPSVQTMEYDGSNYLYDVNGRVVPTSTGNGQAVKPYKNEILRTGYTINRHITLNTKYKVNYQPILTHYLKVGQSNDQLTIQKNKNRSSYITSSLEAIINKFIFSGTINYKQQKFTHSNRNGFLNRVYQSALLTPISFSNEQGTSLANGQRSYATAANNPFFLLENNTHCFLQQQTSQGFFAEYKKNKWKAKLTQTSETVNQRSNESYQPGTAFFPSGINLERNQKDNNFLINTNIVYTTNTYPFKMQWIGSYSFNSAATDISYLTNNKYRYHRFTHDASLSFLPDYRINNKLEVGANLSNKMYSSSTTTNSQFLLPSISVYTRISDLFNANYFNLKLFTSYNRLNSEPSISKSVAGVALLQYDVTQSAAYLPITEVKTFKNLSPIKHKELNAGAELDYKGRIRLSANWFNRKIIDDVFPTLSGQEIVIKNLATHKSYGIEWELYFSSSLWSSRKLNSTTNFSFTRYKSKVLQVQPGFDKTPIAGFSNVYKALVQNQPLGVIMGSTWLKDAVGNKIIDSEGFPIVNNNKSIIGNSLPDFIMKLTNSVSYKKWGLNIDCEWKKGGEVWNGTQAMLDYYGRSQNTANLRSTTNYVFEGVQQSGVHNNIPVNFYDASKPLAQNRWVRYGESGVAEEYIQKADYIKINTLGLYYKTNFKKHVQQLTVTVYANNILCWSPYKGADVNQLLYDMAGTSGLDFFNLPSLRSFGCNIAIQF